MDVLADSIAGGGPQVVFLLGLALLCVILLMRSKRYFRQVTHYQVPKPHSPPPKVPAKTTAAIVSREAEKLEVSMHELARDLSGQLDSKIRVLELLIREANAAAERLEVAVQRADGTGQGAGDRGQGTREITPNYQVASSSEQTPRGFVNPAVEVSDPLPKQRPRFRAPSRPRQAADAQPLKIAGNPRFERIYALADAGLSVAKIANQIGSQIGEVELILSLRGTAAPIAGRNTPDEVVKSD